jgi:peroxiredoxin Q/BCP
VTYDDQERKMQQTSVNVGDPAPDFELPSAKHGNVSLSGMRGKNVLIAFYPRDFTGG